MTACKSQGYTGGLLLCNNLRSKAVTSSDVLWRLQAILIDNILILGRRQHDFLSPANRCWFCLFQRVWSDPTTGPVSVPFLSVSLICISPHIEGKKKLLRAAECAFRRMGVLDPNAISRWYEWKSPFTFSPAAAYCQSLSAFWTPVDRF